MWKDREVSELVGLTLKKFEVNETRDEIYVESYDGRKFRFQHDQNCCESVTIEDVCGDVEDLVDTPILKAQEDISDKAPFDKDLGYEAESQTWTFYSFRTMRGTVTIRWWGRSNGYYSERVDFEEEVPNADSWDN